MIELEFNVNKQTLTRTDKEKVVSNSSNIHRCHFKFSSDWNDKEKTATFYKYGVTATVLLDEQNCCFIPSKFLKTSNRMELQVGVFGVNGDSVITSTLVTIPLVGGSDTDGTEVEVEYNLFEQIMQRIDQVKKGEVEPKLIQAAVNEYISEHPFDDVIVSEIADYVTEHIADLKGDKGDTGAQGIQGVQGEKGEKGDKGDNGKSAYQIAVDNGYSGTEEQWLESLKGADGTSYDDTEIKSEINDIWKANGENNLIVEAYNFGGTWRNSQYWSDAQETFNGYAVKHRNASWNGLSKQVYVESEKIYTFSAWVKAENASDIRVYTREPSEDTGITNILDVSAYSVRYSNKIPNNTWCKVMATFECSTSGTIHPSVVNANSGNTYVSRYELVEGIPQGGIYHVEKDGSGDYTSFVDCINDACQYMDSTVYVGAGVYDLLSELGESYVNNASNSNMGIVLKNRVHVICDTNAILEMKYIGSLSNVKEWLSAINTGVFGATLENAHIETDNVRYSIHDDQGSIPYPYINKFINCTLIHTNGMYENCIGGGIGKDANIEIKGCYFKGNTNAVSLVYYHANNKSGETSAKGRLIVSDNYFADNGTFSMLKYGDSTEVSTAYLSNNSFGQSPFVGSGSYAPNDNVAIIDWNNIIRSDESSSGAIEDLAYELSTLAECEDISDNFYTELSEGITLQNASVYKQGNHIFGDCAITGLTANSNNTVMSLIYKPKRISKTFCLSVNGNVAAMDVSTSGNIIIYAPTKASARFHIDYLCN